MATRWREPDLAVQGTTGSSQECAAARMWRAACGTLCAPDAEGPWRQIVEASPKDQIWHSLTNCVAYQAGVWQSLLSEGMPDVVQPAAFKLALVLRHTPPDLALKLLAELLRLHPQSQDLTSYILALLTDDEVTSSMYNSSPPASPSPPPPCGPAPLRDLQLFGDCELAVLAATREEYDAHAHLVRAEYANLSQTTYVELRVKILNQFLKIPKLFHTPEFESLEVTARENIDREINALREQLLTGVGNTRGAADC